MRIPLTGRVAELDGDLGGDTTCTDWDGLEARSRLRSRGVPAPESEDVLDVEVEEYPRSRPE